MSSDFLFKKETYTIIGACMEVHKALGNGFLEVIYKDALEVELKILNVAFSREHTYNVFYKETLLPHYYVADFLVNDEIIVEVKCVKRFKDEHIAQTLNYLKASNKKVALLINFSRGSLEYRRLVR